MLSYMRSPGIAGTSQGQGGEPDIFTKVDALLKTLEMEPPPSSPQYSPWRKVVGAIGDSILAMSSVRAGGGPQPGRFGAQMQAEQAQHRLDTQRAGAANRETRNRIRIGAFEDEQRRLREKEVAGVRGQNVRGQIRNLYTVDDDGNPITIPYTYNPATGSIAPVDPEELAAVTAGGGPEKFVPPVIMSGTVIGDTGQPQASILKIPRGPGPTTRVSGPSGRRLEPLPPPGLVTETGGKVGVLEGIPGLKKVFNESNTELQGDTLLGSETLGKGKNWLQAQTAGTRFQPIAMPVSMQKYYNALYAILFPYVRSVSGLVFPESELKRYESRMPIPGVTDPSVVDGQWESLIGEMVRDIQAKYGAAGRTPPGVNSGAPPATPSVDDILSGYEKEYGGANPTP
jgi:hypothetical protein